MKFTGIITLLLLAILGSASLESWPTTMVALYQLYLSQCNTNLGLLIGGKTGTAGAPLSFKDFCQEVNPMKRKRGVYSPDYGKPNWNTIAGSTDPKVWITELTKTGYGGMPQNNRLFGSSAIVTNYPDFVDELEKIGKQIKKALGEGAGTPKDVNLKGALESLSLVADRRRVDLGGYINDMINELNTAKGYQVTPSTIQVAADPATGMPAYSEIDFGNTIKNAPTAATDDLIAISIGAEPDLPAGTLKWDKVKKFIAHQEGIVELEQTRSRITRYC